MNLKENANISVLLFIILYKDRIVFCLIFLYILLCQYCNDYKILVLFVFILSSSSSNSHTTILLEERIQFLVLAGGEQHNFMYYYCYYHLHLCCRFYELICFHQRIKICRMHPLINDNGNENEILLLDNLFRQRLQYELHSVKHTW